MKKITKVNDIHAFSNEKKREGRKIALIPTMGYLHEGHLSLVRKAAELADIVIVSIFVNPTQFAPNEDLNKYPRDEKRDIKLLEDLKVDAVFIPKVEEIYSQDFQTNVEVGQITQKYEGEFRPTHFKGVTTIVAILFNCVKPDIAIFGQKDAQQAAVIIQMVRDLKFDIEIIVAPIVRESDGLALSSRNVYLSEQERKDALVLNRSLLTAREIIKNGEYKTDNIIRKMTEIINSVNTSKIDYIRIVNTTNFSEVKNLENGKEFYILIACKIGKTRLIDNLLVKL
jgi:pantoate--beta-alanine ligase